MHDIFLNCVRVGEGTNPRLRTALKWRPVPTRWQYAEVVEVAPLEGVWAPEARLMLLQGLILKRYLLLLLIRWGFSLSTLTM